MGAAMGDALGALLVGLDDPPEPSESADQGDCKGCGAHLRSGMTRCEYCRRETPLAARLARLQRFSQNSLPTHPAQMLEPTEHPYYHRYFPGGKR